MKVGIIGMGNMGLPVAERLLEAGHDVQVHSRRRIDVSVGSSVAAWAQSPRSCAEGVEVVLTLLPDGDAVAAVLEGEDGVLAGLRPESVVADLSTIGVHQAERIAAVCTVAGAHFLDAPVSGGPTGARAGSLGVMVGGNRAAYERAVPVLADLGTPHLVGGHGSGQRVKLVNQVVVAATTAALAEAFALAGGDDADQAYPVLGLGMADSRLLHFAWPRMLAEDWTPGFRIEHMVKDIELILELAGTEGERLKMVNAALAHFRRASEVAGPDAGTQAVLQAVQESPSEVPHG